MYIYIYMFIIYIYIYIYYFNIIFISIIIIKYILKVLRGRAKTILRNFLNFWTWQNQERNNSARLSQFLNLTTSKTKQVCQTSLIFEVDNIKNGTVLPNSLNFRSRQHQKRNNSARLPQFSNLTTPKTKQFCETSFKNGKLAELMASYQCVLRFVHFTCLRCCTCHTKSSQQAWRSDAPKCNLSQEISALTSEQLWWTCHLYCACHVKDILQDPLHMSHACHCFRKCNKTLACCSLLTRCIIPEACHAKRHLNVKSTPNPYFFYTFDFEMCFVPQRHALFRHLNFQTCSDTEVFCTCCTFCTSKNDFLQHDPRNRPFMGFEGSHSSGEIGMERERDIYIYICIYLFTYSFIFDICKYYIYYIYILRTAYTINSIYINT